MLISPQWQRMWMESQHCSKSIANAPLPSQQAKRVLEDLRTHCCSPIKAVQLEALKCWGMWIHNQEPEDWKLNTVCFAAVRPLIANKLQPLHKDVDICTVKLSLMWALLVKVENIILLEGPQYILEVFLQSCLTWLPSADDDECETHMSSIILQLLLRLFKKDEIVTGIDKDEFPPLTVDVLHSKKTFHRLAENLVKVFAHWRKVREKTVILKLWKHFLEHCELSCELIPVPIWHKIFKQAVQIFSEKGEPVKERLAFLHGCATSLKSALSSSKFIDFGNLLTTPCEALLKMLVELCCTEVPDESTDSEMFYHSKEICQVLSVKSVSVGGYALCISVLDILDEFWLRDLFWGVWCGLVYCYKVLLQDIDQREFTKVQTKFYRRLRGVAVNFELDRNNIHKDCINVVEEHISALNIGCLFVSHTLKSIKDSTREEGSVEPMDTEGQPSESPPTSEPPPEEVSKEIVECEPKRFYGKFSNVIVRKRLAPGNGVNLNFDLIEDILKAVGTSFLKSSLNCSLNFLFIKLPRTVPEEAFRVARTRSLEFRPAVEAEQERESNVPGVRTKTPSPVPECAPAKENRVSLQETKEKNSEEDEEDKEMVSTPLTRSRRRAEEEKEKELERQTRRKRKSFEDLVQEILQKNKERKTEKNSKKKSPLSHKAKRNKKKLRKPEEKIESKPEEEPPGKQLRNTKKEEPKKEKKSKKTDGKLENYFKVLSKKSEKEAQKEEKKPRKTKKTGKENKRENRCCKPEKEEGEKKGEIGWRQTSLKTMMSQRNQVQGRPRSRKNKMAGCPLANLSPFKEVLHDHEYVKMDPERLQGSILFTPPKRKAEISKEKEEKPSKPEVKEAEVLVSEVKECEEVEVIETETLEQMETSPIAVTQTPNRQEECKTLHAEEVIKDGKRRVQPEEDTLSKVVKIEETPPTVIEIEETPPRAVEIDETPPRVVEIDETPPSVVEIEETPPRAVDIKETPLRAVKMKEIPSRAVETEETPSRVVEIEETPPKVVEIDETPPRVVEIEETPPSVVEIDETPPKILEIEEPPSKMLEIEEPSSRVVRIEEPPPRVVGIEETPTRRGIKRLRTHVEDEPNKRIKLEVDMEEEMDDEEEKLPPEAEKENLEERQSPREKTGSSPLNTMSRALRMIALVPESTKGGQVQRESLPRAEALKSKKGPNVDRSSRASKMLALLSENVVELEDVAEVKMEDVGSWGGGLATTPNAKTPTSSLKSPKSIKKRRSIRFDDARNETVLYQTDTPPSQILEEKEKSRRSRLAEIMVNCP